jgi:hypothetical protein
VWQNQTMSENQTNAPSPEQPAEALLREGNILQDGVKFVDATLAQLSKVEEAWRSPTGHPEVDASGRSAAAMISEEAAKLQKLQIELSKRITCGGQQGESL